MAILCTNSEKVARVTKRKKKEKKSKETASFVPISLPKLSSFDWKKFVAGTMWRSEIYQLKNTFERDL